MKIYTNKNFIFLFLLPLSFDAHTQNNTVDSLLKVLQTQKEDTAKVNVLLKLGDQYWGNGDYQSILQYARQALSVSEKINFKSGKVRSLLSIGLVYSWQKRDEFEASKNYMSALKIARETGNRGEIADCYAMIALSFYQQGNPSESLKYSLVELKIREELGDQDRIAHSLQGLGAIYEELKNGPEALKYYARSLDISKKTRDTFNMGVVNYCMGDLYLRMGQYEKALQQDSAALKFLLQTGNEDGIASAYDRLAAFYEKRGDLSSGHPEISIKQYGEAIKNYIETLKIWQNQDRKGFIAETDINLGRIFLKLHDHRTAKKYIDEGLRFSIIDGAKEAEKNAYLEASRLDSSLGNYKNAYDNYKKYQAFVDSMNTDESARKGESYRMQYEYEKKDAVARAEQEKKDSRARRSRNLQYAAIGIVLFIAAFFYWSSRQRQNANKKIQKAYAELKATQQQLIQSEKMASLGELTAGIAHEIQNPLNFVNNFSEVNQEMVDELQNELKSGNVDEAIAISKDIKDNSEKIKHHGKRADAIVKGMLQHSRSSSGIKEPTDINALCDEYLRLAYQGLRAKDRSFNVEIKTDLDNTIEKMNIVPQEIGRAILNLINNALYAVNEKAKLQAAGYEPLVLVGTKRKENKVEIKIRDNGNGIPQKILDKIFQPFFTTRPTGQGTGLGLSLAYDIVKAHGGEIKVETKEGEGSEFVIQLPISKTSGS